MSSHAPIAAIVLGGKPKKLVTFEVRLRSRVRDTLPQAALFLSAVLASGYIFWLASLDERLPPDIYSRIFFVGLPFTTLAAITFVEAFRIAHCGQTPGMKSNQIEIVRYSDGTSPTLPRACVRAGLPVLGTICPTTLVYHQAPELSPWCAILMFALIHLSSFWHRERRGWHDRLSGLIAVAKDEYE